MLKKSIISLLLFLLSFSSYAQYLPEALGYVHRVRNVPVFMYAHPIADYEEVENLTAIASGITVGLDGEVNINEVVNELVAKAKRKQRKGKIADFDAIIVNPDNYSGTLIRFYEEPVLLSEPMRISSVPIFIYSSPEADYEEVSERWSFMTLSAYSEDTYQRMQNIVRRAKRRAQKGKTPPFDAIVIDPVNNTHSLIRYY